MNKITGIILYCLLGSIAVNGATIYQTGFESENEPFGAVKQVGAVFAGAAGAKLSTQIKHNGTQSITPGPGSGGYGKFLTKNFKPELKAKELWLQYSFKPTAVDYPKYQSFMIIKGTAAVNKTVIKAAAILFYSKRIVVGSGKYYKFDLTPTWHQVKIKLNLINQSYDLYVDKDFVQLNIPFVAKIKSTGMLDNISLLQFGGGASSKALTYFDDLYIGTTTPTLQKHNVTSDSLVGENDGKAFVMLNKASATPVIDGEKDDIIWQQASQFTPFLTIKGELTNFQQTTARMSYDDKNLYLLFECFDMQLNPVMNQLAEIKKNAKGQDDGNVFKDDSIEIFLAPNPNRPEKYYQFAISASGAVFDQQLPAPGSKWNGKIEKAISFNDKSWIVEIKIPFASLGIKPPQLNSEWNINLCRNKPSLGEVSCWNPTYSSFHAYDKWGKIKFSNQQPAVAALLPKKLTEGSNTVKFKLSNNRAKIYQVSSQIAYKNADTVKFNQSVAVKNQQLQAEVIVATRNEQRSHCRSCTVNYQLKDKVSGELLFATPTIVMPLTKRSLFKTHFLAESSGIYFVFFNDFYINQQSSLHRMLLIQYGKELAGKFKECELIINMPDYMTIINPRGQGKKWAPSKVMTRLVKGKSGQRREYTLTYPASLTYSQKKIGMGNRYGKRPSLVFACGKVKAGKEKDYITYYTQTKINGKVVKEPINKLPLTVLPKINGKMPKKILIISSFGNYNNTLTNLSRAEQEQCIANLADAGFNMFSYMDLKLNLFSDELLQLIRRYGLKIEKGIFIKKKAWIKDTIIGEREYLQQYPQYCAVDGNGVVHKNSVAISHKLEAKSNFLPVLSQSLIIVAQKSDSILWDHEMRQLGPESLGYDKQSLRDFATELKLSRVPSIKAVQTTYRKPWIKFQCRRNAELGQLMANIVKKANPDCLFNVYSGYQSWAHQTHYGVNWKLFSKFIDNAECGYRRPLTDLANTLQAIGRKKLITGELIACNSANSAYDIAKLKINLFRRLTDSTGGILLFYDLQVDGRFWYIMGELTRLVAEHENFFIQGKKSHNSPQLISGMNDDNIVIYTNGNREKLIILFNESGKNKKCKLLQNKLPASAVVKDYYNETMLKNKSEISITIKPFDVKVLLVK